MTLTQPWLEVWFIPRGQLGLSSHGAKCFFFHFFFLLSDSYNLLSNYFLHSSLHVTIRIKLLQKHSKSSIYMTGEQVMVTMPWSDTI